MELNETLISQAIIEEYMKELRLATELDVAIVGGGLQVSLQHITWLRGIKRLQYLKRSCLLGVEYGEEE